MVVDVDVDYLQPKPILETMIAIKVKNKANVSIYFNLTVTLDSAERVKLNGNRKLAVICPSVLC